MIENSLGWLRDRTIAPSLLLALYRCDHQSVTMRGLWFDHPTNPKYFSKGQYATHLIHIIKKKKIWPYLTSLSLALRAWSVDIKSTRVNHEQPSVDDTRCSLIYAAAGAIPYNFCSREMVLSTDWLHFRDHRIDISPSFNLGYYWFNINKFRKKVLKKINNCGKLLNFVVFYYLIGWLCGWIKLLK